MSIFLLNKDNFNTIVLKLSLLRREYLSWVVNVLTSSPNIFHIAKADFFQINCLHSGQ